MKCATNYKSTAMLLEALRKTETTHDYCSHMRDYFNKWTDHLTNTKTAGLLYSSCSLSLSDLLQIKYIVVNRLWCGC